MAPKKGIYAEILLPLALENTYTYQIPEDLAETATFGKRVEVQFGSRKRYAGLIVKTNIPEPNYRTKEIISLLDDVPIILKSQLAMWDWMANYYCCTPGEVMKAALPGALLLSSETVIQPMPTDEDSILQLDEPLYTLFRIIAPRQMITLDELQKASGLKSLYPHVVKLYQMGMILVIEELAQKYIPKKIKLVQVAEAYRSEKGIQEALELVSAYDKQTQFILGYLMEAGDKLGPVETKRVLAKADVSRSTFQTLVKKGVFDEVVQEVNRMDLNSDQAETESFQLTALQEEAVKQIQHIWEEKDVALLHGVTGSGKTIIYKDLIRSVINEGGQVLYLVPEIGMSVQLLQRLKATFGSSITISHSRLNANERVDVWQQVASGIPIVAGVRSSVFLPFQNLKLIIVDEEHDVSYKQQEPNPRYHARDMALVLAMKFNAKVVLGSATPSIESYYHAQNGKYGLVELKERYLGLELPEVMLIDRKKDKSSAGAMYSHSLIEAMRQTLDEGRQVIIYKNRRGYAPVLKCTVCAWFAECNQCDVAMTYHKGRNVLICHLCGTTKAIIPTCPACGSPRLKLEGYGTEKIEDELQEIFPKARIKRMDLDTTRGRKNLENLIHHFEHRNIDILVGTQMVTKGLDFDHVGLVGVIYADQALHYPDFRATERTYQTLVQVSGRAGRKNQQGQVMIQTFQPEHPVYRDVLSGDFSRFYEREIKEREHFRYPPFVRQIAITVRHKQADMSREAAQMLAIELKQHFGQRIMGPSVPSIGRVRNYYIHQVFIKMERGGSTGQAIKRAIREFQTGIVKKKSLSTVRISVDVDPSQ